MKAGLVIAAMVGVAVGLGVVAYVGFGAVVGALQRLGWSGFALLVGCQLALIPVLGAAWAVLTPGGGNLARFTWGRLLRDAATEALPFSPVGGFVIGARGASLAGAAASLAFGSTIVDVTTELLAQLAYVGAGLALMLARNGEGAAGAGWLGLLIAPLAAGGFILFQRRGLGWLLAKLEARWPAGAFASALAVHGVVVELYRRPVRLAASFGLHLAGWFVAAAGTWIALRLLGSPIGVHEVVAMESLVYAVRSAAFAAPAGLGVQEAAYAVLGAAVGLSPETAVALSLVKRARDLAIAVPALLVWQTIEGRRLAARPIPRP